MKDERICRAMRHLAVTPSKDLSLSQNRQLQAHLAICTDCANTQKTYDALRTRIHNAVAQERAPDLTPQWPQILKNIQARQGLLTPTWAAEQCQLAHTSLNLGEGDREKNLVMAIAHFQNALDVYTSQAHPLQRVEVLYDLGCTYCDLSELPEKDSLTNLKAAYTCYKEALDVVRKHHLADVWITKLDQACYQQRMRELRHCANIAKQKGDSSVLKHQLASALDYYVQALGLYRLVESHPDEAVVLKNIENIQCSLQNMDTVISMGEEVALYRKAGEANLSHIEERADSYSHQSRSAVLDRPAHNEIIISTSDETSHAPPPLPDSPERERFILLMGKMIVKRRRRRRRTLLTLLMLVILVGSGIVASSTLWAGILNSPCATAPGQLPLSADGIGVVKTAAGECIGLSDGTVAFDVNQPGRTDSTLKQQAAETLAKGDRKDAIDLLQQAVKQDRSDAEARIYLEDLQVQNSGQPYITLVIGTKITGQNINPTGERNNLQGAYIAQQEHNNNCTPPHCIPVRLLIANTGNDANNAITVAQQIEQATKHDRTIIGVEGWSVSQDSFNMVSTFSAAQIPMVSSAASSDLLTGISPYFFRVAPPDSNQAELAALYATNTLHAQHIALFVDPSNAYSWSLASAFKHKITGGSFDLETYTVGSYAQNKDLARDNLKDVASYRPDLIYFAGYQKDAAALLEELQTYKQLAQTPVMGGDAFDDLVSDPSQHVVGLDRLIFTDFAAPDEWHYIAPSVQEPPFFREYAQVFASGRLHSDVINGDNVPSGATMLSYDGMRVLLQASQTAFAKKNTALTGQDLQKALKNGLLAGEDIQQALTTITGSQAFQGVSGQIAFGQDGNPQNKAVVILSVDTQGKIHIRGTEGTFLLP